MPTVSIEFYDSGVRISDGQRILANSTSCALIESDGTIKIGIDVEQQAHLRPRECSRNFWSKLSKNSDTKFVISNTEIALHHLKYLWDSADVADKESILITPTTLDKQDLGLLLGICKKLSIKVVGIIANAVLAMQHPTNNCKAVYLDLLLRQFSIVEIIQNDIGMSLQQPNQVLNFGLTNFIQNNAQSIAGKFISDTRFDPLHSASDEQQFFDKLPIWLSELSENNSIECKLTSDDKMFSITIENEFLQTTNKLLFSEIASYLNLLFHDHDNIAIYCSSNCKQVFGLNDFLTKLPGCSIIQLDEISLAEKASQYRNEIILDEQVHYINALPWINNKTPDLLDFSPGKLSNVSSVPTHILIDGHAHSLQQGIYIENNDTQTKVIITTEKTSNSLCKIIATNLFVEVRAFDKQLIYLNDEKVENITTANISDCLNISNHSSNYFFIKVVKNET